MILLTHADVVAAVANAAYFHKLSAFVNAARTCCICDIWNNTSTCSISFCCCRNGRAAGCRLHLLRIRLYKHYTLAKSISIK
jgi:hypothetical protein